MAAPIFQSSDPANGATNVFLNKSLKVKFENALLASTVAESNVSLTDVTSNRYVEGAVNYDSSNKQIIFSPANNLVFDTVYRLSIIGTDLAIGTPIQASDGTSLASTIDIQFTTGRDVYTPDTTVAKTSDQKSREGDLDLPANIGVLGTDFTVDDFNPDNHSFGISPSTTGFSIIFSKPLSTGEFSENQVSVTFWSLMDDDDYLAATVDGGTVFKFDASADQSSYFADPSYSVSATGAVVNITLTTGNLCYNQLVEVTVDKDIRSASGDTYANEDIVWQFATQVTPSPVGIRTVVREVPSAMNDLYADYIGALMFKNTILCYERTAKKFSLTGTIPKALRQYVMYQTIVDIIEDLMLNKELQAGVRRQIGDFMVDVNAGVIGKEPIKLARARKAAEKALMTILRDAGVRVGWKGRLTDPYTDIPNRLWWGINGRLVDRRFRTYQPNLPASNVATKRKAEVPPAFW